MEQTPAKLVVGLVGGIGSGKSEVAAAFAAQGARVIAGDELAHQALREPEIKQRIVERWSSKMLGDDGEIFRRRLAEVVFADERERHALEAIVHPWIRQRIRDEVARGQADPAVRLIVLDAAVMLEAGWNEICDRLVYIDAPWEVRLRRVEEQRGWHTRDLEARERAQMPLTEKAARADHVIENSRAIGDLNQQVDHLLRQWGLANPRPTTMRGSD